MLQPPCTYRYEVWADRFTAKAGLIGPSPSTYVSGFALSTTFRFAGHQVRRSSFRREQAPVRQHPGDRLRIQERSGSRQAGKHEYIRPVIPTSRRSPGRAMDRTIAAASLLSCINLRSDQSRSPCARPTYRGPKRITGIKTVSKTRTRHFSRNDVSPCAPKTINTGKR